MSEEDAEFLSYSSEHAIHVDDTLPLELLSCPPGFSSDYKFEDEDVESKDDETKVGAEEDDLFALLDVVNSAEPIPKLKLKEDEEDAKPVEDTTVENTLDSELTVVLAFHEE